MTDPRAKVQEAPTAAGSGPERWYFHDGNAWTASTVGGSVDDPVPLVRRPGRTRLRYRPLWQWVGLAVLAIVLTLGWLLAVSGTHGLPCH
jgi:hypothetical protein